jgi:leucyl aminopeptidase
MQAPLEFILSTYKPPGEVKAVLVIVGKGVTFYSGGLDCAREPHSGAEGSEKVALRTRPATSLPDQQIVGMQGSESPPKFIHLTYKPPGEVKEVLAIVGKGVTFDSGGYNLKGPGSLIEKMKFDMGGAAATFGAALSVAEIAPENVEVHFISAACENMINGGAYRPGDVLVSAAGKTVEVGNTDAEGRLTLCDAIHFAQTQAKATTVVDIATLTGAQIVALGMVCLYALVSMWLNGIGGGVRC